MHAGRPRGEWSRRFAFDDVLADVAFVQVIVQRDVGTLEDKEEFGLVVAQMLERLVWGGACNL